MNHELWQDVGGDWPELVFCLAGLHGNDARASLSPDAKHICTVHAVSHFEAVTKYYAFMGWGEYTTEYEELDREPYPADWDSPSD